MARVEQVDVEAIFTPRAGQDVAAAIADANTWIDAVLKPEGVDEGILTVIEKYLAAHLLTAKSPRAAQASIRGQSVRHEGKEEHRYLLMAMGLDPTGLLAKHFASPEKRTQARIEVIAPATV